MRPLMSKKRREREGDGADANAPPKVLRKDHAAFRPTQSTIGEKSTRLDTGSTLSAPILQETPADVSDPDPLSYAKPQSIPKREIAQSSKGATVCVGEHTDSEESLPLDVVDHIVPPGYFSELRHLRNEDFLNQYNMNLARQTKQDQKNPRKGKRRYRKLDQEFHSLKSADTEVQVLRNQTKNLEALLEAEVDMKKATEARNVELVKELESLLAKFSDLQVNNTQLSQQVSSLQAQITSEERIKAAFEEFKSYIHTVDGDHWCPPLAVLGTACALFVMKCAKSREVRQAFADVVSAELANGMSEGMQYGIEHGKAGRYLGDVEAYDPKANEKFVKALQDLKDLKYPIVDQLERLKDSPIDLIMVSLHLESDTGEDAPQWILPLGREEEISLEDAIAANISRAEKKKKCRVIRHTDIGDLKARFLRALALQIAARSRFSSSKSKFSRSSSSLCTSSTAAVRRALIPSPKLRLALSTSPLDCGCFTEAKRCVIFNLSHQSLNGLSLNCLPLSEIISPGRPKRHIERASYVNSPLVERPWGRDWG
ncbi:hypothetical protein Tco_1501728 [Tanacetum coccineum]